MPIQDATQSQAFSAIALALKSRIVNGVPGANASNTFLVCAPDDKMADHLGEPGYRLRVSPPQPGPMSGAGRGGYLTERRVEIYVITESLADPGGIDEKAVVAHLNAEDAVVNAVLLSPDSTLPYGTTVTLVGDLVKHIPGGDPIGRMLKQNPAIIVSSVPLSVMYVPKIKVLRD